MWFWESGIKKDNHERKLSEYNSESFPARFYFN